MHYLRRISFFFSPSSSPRHWQRALCLLYRLPFLRALSRPLFIYKTGLTFENSIYTRFIVTFMCILLRTGSRFTTIFVLNVFLHSCTYGRFATLISHYVDFFFYLSRSALAASRPRNNGELGIISMRRRFFSFVLRNHTVGYHS